MSRTAEAMNIDVYDAAMRAGLAPHQARDLVLVARGHTEFKNLLSE